MSQPEPMTTVFDVMEPETPYLTAEVISALRSIFGERDIETIVAMPAFKLAQEISVSRESSDFPADIQPIRAANALLEFIETGGFVAKSSEPATQTIKVELPKTLDQMTMSELLTELRDNPNRYVELAPHIETLPEVRKISSKAPYWALRDATSKLDVKATVGYVTHLNKRTSLRLEEVGGRRPTSLARIFNQEERPMLNPFATKQSEVAVTGPFYGDFNLGNLSEERHLAYVWARKHHSDWPKQIDLYEDVPAAFAEELKGRWKKMVDAYNAAKEDGDPTTEGLSRYAPADYVSGSRLPFGGEPEPKRDEAWYREQLEQHAGRGIDQRHADIHKGRQIVRFIEARHGDVTLNGTIVLESVNARHGSIRGRVLVHKSSDVSSRHGTVSATVVDMTYEQLFNEAVEQGIIPDDDTSGGSTTTFNHFGQGDNVGTKMVVNNHFSGDAPRRTIIAETIENLWID